ncbi:MAG: hypothetical protein AB8I08_30975 [Sandaracinaceae bacterium]
MAVVLTPACGATPTARRAPEPTSSWLAEPVTRSRIVFRPPAPTPIPAPPDTDVPAFVLTDACLEAPDAPPLFVYRPPCEFAPATRFWRGSLNLVSVPSEPAGGSCHDDDILFPAPTAHCEPAPIVRIGRSARAWSFRDLDRSVPDGWATVVQLGVTELPDVLTPEMLAEVDRVGGARFVLSLSVFGPLDLAALAPFADRLIALYVTFWCGGEGCSEPLDLGRLPPMPELRELGIGGPGTSVRRVESLRRHPRLVDLSVPELTSEDARALGELRGLSSLATQGGSVAALRRLRALRQAFVVGSVDNMRALLRHRQLRSLTLFSPVSDEALGLIARARSLRHLSIGLVGYTDAGARSLQRARQLETLLVRARWSVEEELESRLTELPSLAHHPTASLFVDTDEIVQMDEEPWATVLCAQPGQECVEAVPDPVGDEVDTLLVPEE